MITCADLGQPPGCRLPVSRPECEGWITGLQDRFGDPPAGAYFWPRKNQETQSFEVSLCYDDANPKHLEYAKITADRYIGWWPTMEE